MYAYRSASSPARLSSRGRSLQDSFFVTMGEERERAGERSRAIIRMDRVLCDEFAAKAVSSFTSNSRRTPPSDSELCIILSQNPVRPAHLIENDFVLVVGCPARHRSRHKPPPVPVILSGQLSLISRPRRCCFPPCRCCCSRPATTAGEEGRRTGRKGERGVVVAAAVGETRPE